jgi:hypothetical protein
MGSFPFSKSKKRMGGTSHVSFLKHADYRWLKISAALSALTLLSYVLIDVEPRHSGSSWYGYTLGTIGAALIVWLAFLGYKKRSIKPGQWKLKSWVSAHVWLGLSLIIVATLHCAFQFGWNVHTLAYVLMMIVIFSGIYGICAYTILPKHLSANRAGMTQAEMLDNLTSIDRQLHDVTQPLSTEFATLIGDSLNNNPFHGSIRARLTNRYPDCPTQAAFVTVSAASKDRSRDNTEDLGRAAQILSRKVGALSNIRRHLQLKAQLEIWLYFHVPVTFALIAALIAHVVSVFFYW